MLAGDSPARLRPTGTRSVLTALALVLVLGGCVLPGGQGGAAGDGAGDAASITGPAVETTTLPPVGSPAAPATETAAPVDASAEAEAEGPEAPAAPEAAPEPAPEPAPPVVKSPAQIACEKLGGRLVRVGTGLAMACQRVMRDAGKSCRRKSDCEGECLARSSTCAPLSPLFGCNDVLQDDGRQVTLCID